jgi:hypothetical protein
LALGVIRRLEQLRERPIQHERLDFPRVVRRVQGRDGRAVGPPHHDRPGRFRGIDHGGEVVEVLIEAGGDVQGIGKSHPSFVVDGDAGERGEAVHEAAIRGMLPGKLQVGDQAGDE